MRGIAILVLITLFVGCGGSTTKEEQNKSNLDSAVKLSILGKTMYTGDNLYRAECNQFYFDFLTTKDYECKSIKVTLNAKTWSIKSNNDNSVALTALESDEKAILKIDDVDYYCYVYTGSLFLPTGEEKITGAHQILTSSVATKPSDLKGQDVFGVAHNGQEVCDALH